MDYSLLLVIEQACAPLTRNQFLSNDGAEVYHVGIIDFLQVWDWSKRREAFYKTTFMRRNGRLISAVPPGEYCRRFQAFMAQVVFSPEHKEL
jgi:hypothetical protein